MKAIFFLLLLFSIKAEAFTLNNSIGAAFKNDQVFLNVSDQACDNLGFSNQELLGMLEEAADRFWNPVPTSRLELLVGQILPTGTEFKTGLICESGSGVNNTSCTPAEAMKTSQIMVACNQNKDNFNNSSSVFGITVTNNIAGEEIVGSVILLNDGYTGSSNPFYGRSRDEHISVLAHEIGHALGLGHSESKEALMYFQSYAGRESLAWDDFYGVTYLYPAEQPISCLSTLNTKSDSTPLQMILTFMGILIIGFVLGRGIGQLNRRWIK